MIRNLFLSIFLLITASVAFAADAAKPNIVLIFVDDIGYGDLGCYGNKKNKTPNIDRLASQGRRFTDAHTASAVCSPSRYGLMTGQFPLRKNFWGPLPFTNELTIDTAQPTLASVLKSVGYDTALIGKWHLGFGSGKTDWNKPLKPGPLELGFDYYFGMPTVNSGPPFVYVENHQVVDYDPADPCGSDFRLKHDSPAADAGNPNIVDGNGDLARVAAEIGQELEKNAAILSERVLSKDTLLVEECVEGEEYAVDMFYDADGQIPCQIDGGQNGGGSLQLPVLLSAL